MASMDKISLASSKHPKPEGAVFQYGTSGFRMNAQLLDPVVFRIGLLASLRSRLYNGEAVGIMITASHNPPEDNGIKLVDPMGEMLETAWEEHGTTLANATDDAALVEAYEFIAKKMQINLKNPAKAIFARDTRVSGPALVKTLLESLEACDVQFQDFGMATTPQLHYLTRAINTEGKPDSFGEPTVEGYYKKMSKAFVTLIEYKKPNGPLIVDCANGIGGPKLKELLKYIPTAAEGGVDIKVVNDDTVNPEKLNYQVCPV